MREHVYHYSRCLEEKESPPCHGAMTKNTQNMRKPPETACHVHITGLLAETLEERRQTKCFEESVLPGIMDWICMVLFKAPKVL